MNLVVVISSILFTLFGTYTCAVLPSTSPSPPSNLEKLDHSASNVAKEQSVSVPIITETKINGDVDDHPGDHDKEQELKPSVKARKGVSLTDNDNGKVSAEVHSNRNSSTDRASTTVTKDSESQTNKTTESTSSVKSKENVSSSNTSTSYASSDKYSPYESKSTSSSNTSSSMSSSRDESTSSSSVTTSSNSSTSKSTSTESTSSTSSINKKPLITYSIEDDPTLLNVPRVRQYITPLTPLDVKAEGEAAYIPPDIDFVPDRMQSKREMYIFPLVVLIFLVPMVLGVGIIVLRRVRDYWSTRHYRRMDFLVDGMYNT